MLFSSRTLLVKLTGKPFLSMEFLILFSLVKTFFFCGCSAVLLKEQVVLRTMTTVTEFGVSSLGRNRLYSSWLLVLLLPSHILTDP